MPQVIILAPRTGRFRLGRELLTYRHAAVHVAFIRGMDEEEDQCRDEGDCGDNARVQEFESAQSLAVISVKYNQENIASHRECPEHVCYWEPANITTSTPDDPFRH